MLVTKNKTETVRKQDRATTSLRTVITNLTRPRLPANPHGDVFSLAYRIRAPAQRLYVHAPRRTTRSRSTSYMSTRGQPLARQYCKHAAHCASATSRTHRDWGSELAWGLFSAPTAVSILDRTSRARHRTRAPLFAHLARLRRCAIKTRLCQQAPQAVRPSHRMLACRPMPTPPALPLGRPPPQPPAAPAPPSRSEPSSRSTG